MNDKYIECSCGCGTLIPALTDGKKSRPRKYVAGHQNKAKKIDHGMIECACGCGTLIPAYNDNRTNRPRKYAFGHQNKGKKKTEKQKRQISATRIVDNGKAYDERNELKMCACGCGTLITKRNRSIKHNYVNGHQNRGRKFTDEHIKNMSVCRIGKQCGVDNPFFGKQHTIETKLILSAKASTRTGTKNHFYGKKHTDESKQKMAEKSRILSKGRVMSPEAIKKISMGLSGKNHYNWKGGISFEPYCKKFNNAFREKIRMKFNHTCFICGITQQEQIDRSISNGKQTKKLSVHHVNYNKDCLCDGVKCEFVPLCTSCHIKTGHNRAYWEKLIVDKLLNSSNAP